MSETKAKKDDLETTMEDLTVKIEQMNANIATLKVEVATLQAELRDLAKSEVEMDALRQKEHEEYKATKADGEASDDAHGKASGGASGIIGMLEVAESDFTKNLADTETEEQNAQDQYDAMKKENEVTR